MIVDTYKDYVCRTGELGDVQEMYDILEPLICDKTRHKFQYQTQQRRLKMELEFYIKNKDSIVVTKGSEVVGVYVGQDNFIIHIANKHLDVDCMVLLFYNVLCKLHGRLKESVFIPIKHQGSYVFNTKLFSKEGIRKEGDKCFINMYTKDKIEYLYNKRKGLI